MKPPGAMQLGASLKDDKLNLATDAKFKKALTKLGGPGEHVTFSCAVKKINRRGKAQDRGLCITSQNLLNLKIKSWKIQRQISLDKISGISKSRLDVQEFAVHVPEEYDYYFRSADRQKIVKALFDAIKTVTGKDILCGEVDNIHEAVVTRIQAKVMSRQERWERYKQMIQDEVDDDDDQEDAETQFSPVKESGVSHSEVTPSHFEYLQVLGRGSFGKVLKVREKTTGDILAMKILKKKDIIERKQVEHTKAEREILARMRHPFLMGMKYAFQTDRKLYFVLHYYSGGELFYHLQKQKKFKIESCRLMVAETALALGHLHSFNFIYRDLKPENLLLDAEGHICVTDFGLAKNIQQNTYAQTFCGTPEYLPPEIVLNRPHNKAVDWWSLGILLYELSVGIPPFYSQNANEMYVKIKQSKLVFPRTVSYPDGTKAVLPEELKQCVAMLLNRDPTQRLGSGPRDVEDIMDQPFFRVLNRDDVMSKRMKPLYQPGSKDNVDPEFKFKAARDTVAPQISKGDKGTFRGFTFAGGASGPQTHTKGAPPAASPARDMSGTKMPD